MTAYFYTDIPKYCLNNFCAVRNAFDNFQNLLNIAEVVNACTYNKTDDCSDNFELVIFSGEYSRALIKKSDGFVSMAIPFQVVDHGDRITFNFDLLKDEVDGRFISIMRNAIQTSRDHDFSHESIALSLFDNFSLEMQEAINYSDAFVSIVSEDHGYFRFDDDPQNENGQLHPRYHIDFFYKNSSSVKVGVGEFVDIDFFYSLFDGNHPKHYLKKIRGLGGFH